mgnify:CR=1 FL=1
MNDSHLFVTIAFAAVLSLIAFGAGLIAGNHRARMAVDVEIQRARDEVARIDGSFFCAAREPSPGLPCKCWQKRELAQ